MAIQIDYAALGKNIRTMRIRRRLTAFDVAKAIGIRIEAYDAIEDGKKVSLGVLVEMCRVLRIRLSRLLTGAVVQVWEVWIGGRDGLTRNKRDAWNMGDSD